MFSLFQRNTDKLKKLPTIKNDNPQFLLISIEIQKISFRPSALKGNKQVDNMVSLKRTAFTPTDLSTMNLYGTFLWFLM
jgi:hypothetical protein